MCSDQVKLEPEQLHMLNSMLSPDEEVSTYAGYAGTGKSTLLAQLSAQRPYWDVLTPTNKAAAVCRAKGIRHAKTVHSAIYAPMVEDEQEVDKDGQLVFLKDDTTGELLRGQDGALLPAIRRTRLSFGATERAEKLPCAVIDEGFMCAHSMVPDLLKHYDQVLFLGDDFQLPPVNGVDIATKFKPSARLTEVHRTAADNPIIKYLTALRNGYDGELTPFIADELRSCDYSNKKLFQTLVEKNVQAICYSNAMRHNINEQLRTVQGRAHNILHAGETIVCLETVRYTVDDVQYIKYYNGEILTVAEAVEGEDFYKPVRLKFTNDTTHMTFPFWMNGYWPVRERSMGAEWNNEIRKRRAQGRLFGGPANFDFSYCLTAHKAQGSEWGQVAVFHQKASLSRTMSLRDRLRWLYTADSRAKDRLLVVNC